MKNEAWQRLQTLRNYEEQELTQPERQELATLLEQADETEQQQLQLATQTLRADSQNIEAQNQVLQHLVQRKERLRNRLHTLLAEAQAERHAIDDEVSRILAASAPSSTRL